MLGGALALPLALAACGTAKATKTSVLLDWVPNTNHTGLYVAQDRGYFGQGGLTVDILPFPESGSVEQLVGAGKVAFGISSSEPVVKARAGGIPVVSIAAIIQHDTSGFASLKAANITRPRDFEGKRYASFGSPTERPLIAKLMAADGGDVNKVQFVETGDSDFLTLAGAGRVDFAWIFEGVEKVDGEVRGLQLNYIPLTAWQQVVPDYYTPVFITSESHRQQATRPRAQVSRCRCARGTATRSLIPQRRPRSLPRPHRRRTRSTCAAASSSRARTTGQMLRVGASSGWKCGSPSSASCPTRS